MVGARNVRTRACGGQWRRRHGTHFLAKTSSCSGTFPSDALTPDGTRNTISRVFVPPQSPDMTSEVWPASECAFCCCCSWSYSTTADAAAAAATAAVRGALARAMLTLASDDALRASRERNICAPRRLGLQPRGLAVMMTVAIPIRGRR